MLRLDDGGESVVPPDDGVARTQTREVLQEPNRNHAP